MLSWQILITQLHKFITQLPVWLIFCLGYVCYKVCYRSKYVVIRNKYITVFHNFVLQSDAKVSLVC